MSAATAIEPLVSDDPAVIRRWVAGCLEAGLHRGGEGVAIFSLSGEGRIHRMAYLPGMAWVMYCDFVTRDGPGYRVGRPKWQAFTRPDMRQQGICTRLCVLAGWPAAPGDGEDRP